ncbi:hypothetical protein NQ176_g7785 [Zarea fungicola]|uniref:Uncharacterized protein n=1 Tax=Zarea fungicola TaxID=93591 RepID=A0ACC1MWY4_9HYPO|nr:hypothetical protein NQ176_g7785 [Lecanicillium fungicola]
MNSYQALVPPSLTGSDWPHLLCSNLDDNLLDMGDLNEHRIARIAEVLADFRNLQHTIAATNISAPSQTEHFTPAWTLLRQCATDGQYILDRAADLSFPVGQNDQEQRTLELLEVLLDAYARRHEAQKIYMRQIAAQRCILARKQVLDATGSPNASNEQQLYACDVQMQQELQQITDEYVYVDLLSNDQSLGRWTAEDPGLYDIISWLHTRS